MQEMVEEFERELPKTGAEDGTKLYQDVRGFLHANLGRRVDLEAVFSVIDSIINWSVDRIGPAAIYHSLGMADSNTLKALANQELRKLLPPSKEIVDYAIQLRERFERFTRAKCEIPEESLGKIEETYEQLFKYFGDRIGGQSYGGRLIGDWSIFTTNYDPALEHYWVDFAKVPLNTGFQYDDVAGMKVSNTDLFRNQGLKLLKLHGSITWLNDPEYGLTEQRIIPRDMKKATGSRFLGQVMLYPIEEKELYFEPYLSMFQQLNRQLASTQMWVVIGYSFADRFIREIFVHNSRKGTRMVLLHPHAKDVSSRLSGFRGRLDLLQTKFGEGDLASAPQALWNAVARA